MKGAPAPPLLLVANALEGVLVVVLVILAALVVLALAGGLVVLLRRDTGLGPEPDADGAPPAASGGGASTPGRPSLTQTPDDVDRRSPADLAAAAQAAEAALPEGSTAATGPGRPLPAASATAPPDPARLRMLGLTLGMLTERMRRPHSPQLGTALVRLVDSEGEAARSQLSTLALSLMGEDDDPAAGDGQLSLFLEEALDSEIARGFSFSSMPEFQQALSAVAPELREKLRTVVWARNADSVAILTTEDVEALERVAVAMATALMIDTAYDVRRVGDQAHSGRA